MTGALLRGVPVEVVGPCPRIIHQDYSHVSNRSDALRAAAAKAVG